MSIPSIVRNSLTAALVLAAVLASSAGAQTSLREWDPDDRTIVGDFSRITSVASGMSGVYVTSPTALLVWHPDYRRWDGPFTPPPTASLARVFGSLVDPIDGSLWLARSDGWLHYQPDIQLWEQGTVPGTVRTIAFDQDAPLDGIYLRTSDGWFTVPRGGGIAMPSNGPARPVQPVSAAEVVRDNPSLQANSAQLLLDERLRQVNYTVAARSYDQRGWYLGTSGVGLLFLPEGMGLPERLPFGVAGERISAVFNAPGGVWVINDRTARDEAAFTFVSTDLSEFRYLRGGPALGLPFTQARRLVGQGASLWAATDRGVVRIEPGTDHVDVVDESRGLPDGRVFSIVAHRGQITAGTAHGVARIDDSLRVEHLAPSFRGAAYAVTVADDSTWIGTGQGLFAFTPKSGELVMPGALTTSVQFQVPVMDLAWMADTLVALTRDELLWRDPANGRWTLGPNLSSRLGRLDRLLPDGDGFWVAGDRGLGFARLATPVIRAVNPGDLPGDVLDLAVDSEFLWIGTTRGLVRFRLLAIRP